MTLSKRELGDFQTPLPLAKEVVQLLERKGVGFDIVLEPTCGTGSFIRAILESDMPVNELVGVEIQDRYLDEARLLSIDKDVGITFENKSVFDINFTEYAKRNPTGKLLVVGNPPWVTNSELGAINGNNLPRKSNVYNFNGMDAITGKSNFDIAEFIWIKLIEELRSLNPTIALLCKTSVARKVLTYCERYNIPTRSSSIYKIDAKKWFNAAVDACLFTVDIGGDPGNYETGVFDSLSATVPSPTIGFVNRKMVYDTEKYRDFEFIEGEPPIEWRQGIKHDAADVLELIEESGAWYNKLGEEVDVESEHIYPYKKGSDFRPGKIAPKRGLILTQKRVGEDTSNLQHSSPLLWGYLSDHKSIFASRKSSIYRNKPLFSVFGVGDYSFTEYKIVIPGFYKEPEFWPIGPIDGKPVLCDDTCYILPCVNAMQAAMFSILLNDNLTLSYINTVIFRDAKRPITKSLLQRVNFFSVANLINRDELIEKAKVIVTEITGDDYKKIDDDFNSILDITRTHSQSTLFSHTR